MTGGASTSQGAGSAAGNLFFALVPDAAVRQALAATVDRLGRHQAGGDGRWSAPGRYHLTVHFLGPLAALSSARVDAARRAAARVQASPFELVLDRTGRFEAGRVDWLGCSAVPRGLERLWKSLGRELAQMGLAVQGERRFLPHLTVRRGAGAALPAVAITPVRWTVETLMLVASDPSKGHGHRTLGRWPLEARPCRPGAAGSGDPVQ